MVQTSTHIAGRPTIFEDRETDLHRSDRGLSLFAQTLLENTTIKPRQKKRLLTIWLIG